MRLLRLPLLAGLALLACGCDSENVSWAFVSNPGGSFGSQSGGIIVIVKGTAAPSADDPQRWIGIDGADRRGPVQVRMLTQGDFVLLKYADRIDLLDPRLPNGSFSASGTKIEQPITGPMAFALDVPDTQVLHPQAYGPGRLVGAAFGSLLVLEHLVGLVVFGDEVQPRVLPAHKLQVTATEFRALAPDQTVQWLRAPAWPPVAERLQRNAQRGSLTIRGPFRERLAEVPESAVRISEGGDGLLFRADFPEGIGRSHPDPFVLLGPRNNRYVLRIDG